MAPRENVLGLRDRISSPRSEKPHSTELKLDHIDRRTEATKAPAFSGFKGNKPREVDLKPEQKLEREQNKERKANLLAESRKKIITGIDLGTTNSGVSYIKSTGQHQDVTTIKNWTGGYSDLTVKVPSVIAYAAENDFDEDRWGHGVEPGDISCRWWKLLLDGSTRVSEFDDPLLFQSVGAGLMHLPDGKTAQEVAADFLGRLYNHTVQTLETIIGREAVNQTPILFNVTVPSKWSFAAREATRQAAQKAGIGSRVRDEMVMADEPEAGCISAIHQTKDAFDKNPFQKGSCVMVVDCGGGTVDLVTYKIVKEDPLQLEEACVGDGGKMGGTAIDRSLHAFMGKRFEKAFTTLPLKKRGGGSHFMNSFEKIKRDFSSSKVNRKFELPLKMKMLEEGNANVNGYDFEDQVLLTGCEIEEFFQPVWKSIKMLIKKQVRGVKKAKMPFVKTVVLCGGLGSSGYVFDKLGEFVEEHLSGKAELVTPERPWSAISEGAAIRGLGKSPVQFLRSCDFIGIVVHKPFVDEEHDEADAFDCPVNGKRARNQMEWHVERGDKITPNMKKKISCYVTIPKEERSASVLVYQDIHSCTADEAPGSFDDSVVKIGSVKMDLGNIVRAERKRVKTCQGAIAAFQEVDIDIFITVGSDKGVLLVTAKSGLKKLGSTEIEYVADPAWKGTLTVGED